MKKDSYSSLFKWGGICGIIGTTFYVLAIMIPMPPILTYSLAMSWPLLSIVFVYALYRYIALYKQSIPNQLALLFASLAFAMVAMMMSIQLAVKFGIDDQITVSPDKEELLLMIKQTLRWVDLGIDVAWDLFIGVALIFMFAALKNHKQFGMVWGSVAGILGIALIVLNVMTFPWPPDTQGLVDIGPAIGLFIILLSIRLLVVRNKISA
jgi:hypothetical protein